MTIKMYAALKVDAIHDALHEKHITLAFSDIIETDKLSTLQLVESIPLMAHVTDVVYWPIPGITVALFKEETFEDVKGILENAGFTYSDNDYMPHITICEGDYAESHRVLVGKSVMPTDVYIRLKDFKDL